MNHKYIVATLVFSQLKLSDSLIFFFLFFLIRG